MEIRTETPRGLQIDVLGQGKRAVGQQHGPMSAQDVTEESSTSNLTISDQAMMMQTIDEVIGPFKQQLQPWYVPNGDESNRTLVDTLAKSLAKNSNHSSQQWLAAIDNWPLNETESGDHVSQRTLRQFHQLAQVMDDSEKQTFERLHNYAQQQKLPLQHVESVAWMFGMDKLFAKNQPDQEMPVLNRDYLQQLLDRARQDRPDSPKANQSLVMEALL